MNNLLPYSHYITESINKAFLDLVVQNTHILTNCVYHGTPRQNLYSILQGGIYGNKHGELNETKTFSTSLNERMLTMFSQGHECGLEFELAQAKVFILPNWLQAILDTESGGSDYHEYEEEELMQHCKQWNLPYTQSYDRAVSLEDNFLGKNLPKDYIGAVYEYVLNKPMSNNDEAEIVIIGHGIEMLERCLTGIYIDDRYFSTRAEAIAYMESQYTEEELTNEDND